MKLAATGTRTGSRTILLIGILAVTCYVGREGSTVISCVLVLHTGLVRDDRIAGWIEGHTVQKSVEGGGASAGHRRNQKRRSRKNTQKHSNYTQGRNNVNSSFESVL